MNKRLFMKSKILCCFFLILGIVGCDQVASRFKEGSSTTNAADTAKPAEAPAAAAAPEAAKADASSTTDALAQKQDKAKAYLNQAFSYIASANIAPTAADKEKLFQSAETELTNAINTDNTYFEAYLNRGVVLMAMGKTNKAEDDLKKAQSLNPKSPDAYFNLACLYSVTNRMDLSADALDSALKNGFNNVDRLRNDPDLNNLRKTKEFKKIVEKYKFFIS